jgi:MFS-type transporter involved in bile tolerance (Atg22 family)
MNRFRHRELLLTLRASTIEASFSVPMLNLTMPSFPFVIAFAAAALGWGPGGIGFMAALPHLCNVVQPLLMTWLRRRLSLYEIMVLTFTFSALPWGFVSLLPFLGETARDRAFMGILTLATLANSLASVSWSAAIAEVVPQELSGRFYGRRNLVFGFWTLLVVLVISGIVDRNGNSLTVFGWIFAAAGLARMTGLFYLTRMKFPSSVTQRAQTPPDLAELRQPLKDGNYLRMVAFIGLWGLLLNLGQPFYTVFLVQGLHRSMGEIGLLTALAGVGGLLTLKGWGWLSDRFGSKPVLEVCSIVWALIGLAFWTFAGERLFWHLALGYLVVGATTAGFQLCQFQLMLKLSPANKAPYVAVFLALSSAVTALGPLLGGLVLKGVPDVLGTFLGQTIRDYHVLILGSMIGCLTSVRLLEWVREDRAQKSDAVWDSMRRMPDLNPLLMLTGAAQVFLSPREFLGFTRSSLRVVRQQVRVIGDVGEELVEGTTEVLRSKLGGDDR